MFEILHPILDWLSTKQGSSPRSGYGWQVIVMIAVGIAGMLKASEVRSKKISLKEKVCQQISRCPLAATICTDEVGRPFEIHARLEKTSNGYMITINNSASETKQQEFESIEEIEAFLEEKTIFKLADFKPCAQQA
ncbi:hypothetical protein [Pseudomonas lopnurensis]|uniref:hypothetical protein n=1 Tax=Pseudomonas lopnurensis TaxID=1477517 RepID=UPI00187A0813|nr:hypothetical protein [Pseudomonas lopnurensis]MBE7374754.1 hypothetical protein [Pseudomonas lopnurensis]